MFISKPLTMFAKRKFCFFLATILIVSLSGQAAFSSPVEDKQQKAARIAREIDDNGAKISAMAEKYNKIRIQLDDLKTSVTQAQAQLESAEAQNDEVKARVQKRAINMYSDSSRKTDQFSEEVDSKRKAQYVEIATGNDSATIRQLVITKETVGERKVELEKQLSSIASEEKSLAEQKKSIEDANKAQEATLKQLKGELAALVAAQRAAREQSQSAPAPKANKSNQALPGNLPAPSPKAAIAIEWARQQLGKPYRYAASGPGSFDCSGLTMMAYRAAGISMPHYSGAQYSMFPKVSQSQLQPGDLVFRGAGGSAHVAIYIGNGMIITAPQTGDVVKIASMGRIIGGARPG